MSFFGKIASLIPKPVQDAAKSVEGAVKAAEAQVQGVVKSAEDAVKSAQGQIQGKNWADTFDNARYLGSQAVINTVAEARDRVDIALRGTPQGPFPSMVDLQKKFPNAGLPDRMMGTNIDDAVMYDPSVDPDKVMGQLEANGMNSVRLGAYWDHIQPNGPGDADFARLDAWLAAAKAHHVKVVLTVGAKAPNWPEYHFPQWAKPSDAKDVSTDPRFCQNTENFVRLVAEHEKGNDAICMWQVENEPFERVGPDHHQIGPALVTAEAKILGDADGHRRPLMINCFAAGDHGPVEQAFKLADVVGLDIYGPVPVRAGSWERTVGAPANALALSKQSGKPLMVAELQADNWGDYRTNAQDITQLTHSLEKMGYANLLFWRYDTNMDRAKQGDNSLTQAEAALAHEALPGKP